MKRIIALVLMIVMLVTLVACGKDKDKPNNDGTNTGNDITSSTNNDNKDNDIVNVSITIDSVKNAKETDASLFEYEDVEGGISITKYNGSDEIVSVPNSIDDKSVVSIGASAFVNCSTVIGLKLADSVVTVEEKAFLNCKSMKVLVTGTALRTISTYGFGNCTSLTDVELNDGLQELKRSSFGFTNIKKIEIPSSVTVIESPFTKQTDGKLIVVGEVGSSIEQYVNEKGAEYNIEFQAK